MREPAPPSPLPLRETRALARRALSGIMRALSATEPFDASRLDRRDPELVANLLPLFELLNRGWLHLRAEGTQHVPRSPALFVGNHNGGIAGPDLSCTMATLWRALGPMPLYAMAHDFAMRRVTPLGRVLQAVGGMRADPENAVTALARGAHVLVYPGGDLDAFRHFRHRHKVIFGRRTGFVRVAQRARVPIVPLVAAGAHQSAVIVHEGEWLARVLGLARWSRLTRFPIALALPWGIGAGPWLPYLPLPFPIHLRILPPILAPESADPAELRDEIVRCMQRAMDEMIAERGR